MEREASKLGMVARACQLNIWDAKAGRHEFLANLG